MGILLVDNNECKVGGHNYLYQQALNSIKGTVIYEDRVEFREFRDNIIEFDIICHFDQWQMNDFKLRPYRIAAEIDMLFNNQKMTGIGELQFLGANQIILTDEFAGLCLMYQAVHGEEDKKYMPNPNEEKDFIVDFDQIFNQK